MTLGEFMRYADQGKRYQVGAISGFFWFGSPDDFWSDINTISKYFKEKHLRYIETPAAKRKKIKRKPLAYYDLTQREVKTTYTVKNGNTAVIVYGEEQGPYWDQKEWDDDKRGYRIKKPLKALDESIDSLHIAVVKEALDDYYAILAGDWAKENGVPVHGSSFDTGSVNRQEIEKFFHSHWFNTLMPGTDGPRLFSTFEKYAKNQVPETPRIRYETKDIVVVQTYNRRVSLYENGEKVWATDCDRELKVSDLRALRRKWLDKEKMEIDDGTEESEHNDSDSGDGHGEYGLHAEPVEFEAPWRGILRSSQEQSCI